MSPSPDRLLLYIHVPFRRDTTGALLIEAQAANGLSLWAQHFSEVTVMAPLSSDTSTEGWVSLDALGSAAAKVRCVPLPMAYRPDQFLARFRKVRSQICNEIAAARWLCFSLGGLFGDWGAVASIQAHKMGKPFAVWTDRVESQVIRLQAQTQTGRAALQARLYHRPMAWLERYVISRATLGLFHGRETYDAYAPYCRQSEVVHNIHVKRSEHITPEQLDDKRAASTSGPLKLIYVGRADDMKGPQDWLKVLQHLDRLGVDFTAEWLGTGSRLAEMGDTIKAAGLGDRVSLPGMIRDREAVFQRVRDAHVFLFCHKTSESPRCLIEALICATPLVGYDGAFARDLISANGGGQFVPIHDITGLADQVAALDKNRSALADLMARAARDADPFDDAQVFKHRAELVRSSL